MTISGKICVKCCVELRPAKNGATILERLPDSKIAAVWLGDIWECPDCKQQTVIGIGKGPVLSRFQFTNEDDWLTALRERCSEEPPAERVSCWHNASDRNKALEHETSQARQEAGTE